MNHPRASHETDPASALEQETPVSLYTLNAQGPSAEPKPPKPYPPGHPAHGSSGDDRQRRLAAAPWRRCLHLSRRANRHRITGRPTHVTAVIERMTRPATVLDAASLATTPFTVTGDGLRLRDAPIVRGRGWLRRLGPPEWPTEMRQAVCVERFTKHASAR